MGLTVTTNKNLCLKNLQIKINVAGHWVHLVYLFVNITIHGVTIEDTKATCLLFKRVQGAIVLKDSKFRNCHSGPQLHIFQQGNGLAIIDPTKMRLPALLSKIVHLQTILPKNSGGVCWNFIPPGRG